MARGRGQGETLRLRKIYAHHANEVPGKAVYEFVAKGGDVAVVPDASHALIPEHPAAVVAAIVAWLSKLPK